MNNCTIPADILNQNFQLTHKAKDITFNWLFKTKDKVVPFKIYLYVCIYSIRFRLKYFYEGNICKDILCIYIKFVYMHKCINLFEILITQGEWQ